MPVLSGKPIAEHLLAETKTRIRESGIIPGLGIVLVGDDQPSRVYVELKERRAGDIGMRVVKSELEETATEAEVLDAVRSFNHDPLIHGIIVQLPLPKHIEAGRIIAAIDPTKDADGFITGNPVFPEAVIELARAAAGSLAGKRGVVIANSARFGGTMKRSLEQEGVDADYVLADSVRDAHIREADIVVTALGRPGILASTMFKKSAIVIDGGIARENGVIRGDVSTEAGDDSVWISPVPGGVGPVTIACLLRRVTRLSIQNREL